MLRSLFAGVSGMRTHQLNMDVIADNIANVNTTGFKAGRMTFKEVYSQLLRAARGPMGDLGGVNPLQVGLGVTMGSIDTLFTQGAPQATGRDLDLSIDGNGFFVLTDGQNRYYTRAGIFSIDSEGNLVYTNGMKVMGWMGDPIRGVLDTNRPEEPIVIRPQPIPGQATSKVDLTGNLDSRITDPSIPVLRTVDIYDSLGNVHSLTLEFRRGDVSRNEWTLAEVYVDGNAQGFQAQTIDFDDKGLLQSPSSITISVNFTASGAGMGSVELRLGSITSMADATGLEVTFRDGYKRGELVRITVDDLGVIKGVYSNDLVRDLGQIALATFPSPEGLVKQSDTLFVMSGNSGPASIEKPGVGDRGRLVPGFLEMSNVDLSQEFTSLILAQRGFQASSRVITTSDEMLQELMTLKR
ncbi:flagellar hook protein FlgE [Geochorda subterranea]|uniref:Flagellar hook protein FlgE n=1 Tax=Geochorda subterranea TaxID=3109564 RepID=A0ABZ1BKE9_9FIRM|nr:flagellar hook protein FlgE [Limnochorda sp. LNt]WRP13332.1 flagellar hook protein FlgE [Limnochorda sp. LNt]